MPSPPLPVSKDHLREEALSEAFIEYMRRFPGFVAQEEALETASAG